ncbi:IclR family transcriptional regulator [Alisedimentitalea sp. MJ-SS2]|uniref:IclR family transcriptional regulator n=1 Tax=Aliisedimentitalea sp. MJ-SS2 TaxID=3049795 RepID=UPI00290F0C7A|nr:IclR family transcriptional regulator [Alisedimentitalea sp. MJ-SS2]MDU8929632.1 IclR family transcriptional regulator [Alisedimentitalea sp. MJ-SS2]
MGTVAKALSLLEQFSNAQPLIGLSDMARLAGLNKATTYRLLTELQRKGFVEQVGAAREYRLGPAVLRLASLREVAVPIRDLARTVVRELSDQTGETAHVTLLSGDMLQVIAYAYSAAHGTKVTMEDAQFLPLHASSSGLAVMAWSASEIVDRALSGQLPARTPMTLTEPDQIRALLPGIREVGYAEYRGGFETDVHTQGAPIFNADAQVIGAISVALPAARFTPDAAERVPALVRSQAIQLTHMNGGRLPDTYPTE